MLLTHATVSKTSLGNAGNVRSRIRLQHGLYKEGAGLLLPASSHFQPLLEGPNDWLGRAKQRGREAARQLGNVCSVEDKGWSPGSCKGEMQGRI